MEFTRDDNSDNGVGFVSENISQNNGGHASTAFSCSRKRKKARFTHKHPAESFTNLSVLTDHVNQDQETRQLKSDTACSKRRPVIICLYGAFVFVLVSGFVLAIIAIASRHDGTDTDKAELIKRIESLEDENKQIISHLDKMSTELKNVNKNLTEILESDCGGVINIPTTKASYLLYYKLNRIYNANETCLWTVENTERSIRSQLTLKVELLSQGFKSNTGLFAFKWNRDMNLTSEEITSDKEHVLSAEGLYFSFISDNKTSTGTGFLVRLTVIKIELKTYGSNLFYRTPSGTYTVSSYNHNDQISILINTMALVTFTVIRIDTEPDKDILYIYEIKEMGRCEEKQRLSGKSTSPVSFSSMYPILAIFSSDASVAVKGFSISWLRTL